MAFRENLCQLLFKKFDGKPLKVLGIVSPHWDNQWRPRKARRWKLGELTDRVPVIGQRIRLLIEVNRKKELVRIVKLLWKGAFQSCCFGREEHLVDVIRTDVLINLLRLDGHGI